MGIIKEDSSMENRLQKLRERKKTIKTYIEFF